MIASLCEAVTGGTGAQHMLEALKRNNVLVVPLDDHRRWYRYHHRFRTRPGDRWRHDHGDVVCR
jgi:LuxR family maltose regulon positive regulatory protein